GGPSRPHDPDRLDLVELLSPGEPGEAAGTGLVDAEQSVTLTVLTPGEGSTGARTAGPPVVGARTIPFRSARERARTTVRAETGSGPDVSAPTSGPAVIGAELAEARNRVGLSVDELAERTRIRPHVIEAIESDDFAPCGGDFYARGHLRTLARVLGRDPGALLARYDAHHAGEPVDARRVFEAELATGMTGSMRSTAGGASWALLLGVVVLLLAAWIVVRLAAAEPEPVLQDPSAAIAGGAITSARAPGPIPTAALATSREAGASTGGS
ncbi:MAG: helix-turn-helix transcriptional regulator, partial [Nocardioidaceae bacterium]